jgi:hypothetical protein
MPNSDLAALFRREFTISTSFMADDEDDMDSSSGESDDGSERSA